MSAYDTAAVPAHTQVPSLTDRLTYARELSQSGLLPSAYRGRPANVLVAIETGHMLGIAPMAAVQNIHVIEGRPTMSAALLSALVRRAGHRVRVTGGDEHAVAEVVRADDPEFTYRSEWTLERARNANLLKKDTWEKYPAAMLKARATSEVCRDACSDVFLGPVYVPEELGAQVDADGEPVVIDQQPADGEQTDPAEQARKDAAARVDWEGDLKTLTGNYEGLRELYRLAKGHNQPQEFLDRVQKAGEDAYERMHNAPSADPDTDAPLCPATTLNAHERGDMVMTTSSDREIALCGDCQQWVHLQSGMYLPHGQQATHTTDETEEDT